MSYFEVLMMLCFGFAWPFSIYKSYYSRSTKGKSLPFMAIVLIGYCSGIIHKAIYSPDKVIFFYILNTLLVTIDILLYMRNRYIEKTT